MTVPEQEKARVTAALKRYCRGRQKKEVADELHTGVRNLQRLCSAKCPDFWIPRIIAFLESKGFETSHNKVLWKSAWSYAKNLEKGPEILRSVPTPATLPITHVNIFDRVLDSPFGLSSSVATANKYWNDQWWRLGISGISTTTRRLCVSRHRPSKMPNLWRAVSMDEEINPHEMRQQPTYLFDSEDIGDFADAATDPEKTTLVNRFDIPSESTEEWIPILTAQCESVPDNKLLIASFTGTVPSAAADKLKALIDNTVECALVTAKCGPHAIELNLFEYHQITDLSILRRILREIRFSLDSYGFENLRLVLKIGPLDSIELTRLVRETVEFVDAYSAINSPRKEMLQPEGVVDSPEWVPLFGTTESSAMGAISGKAIRPTAIEVIQNLALIRAEGDGTRPFEYKIFGSGGATDAVSACKILNAGADMVMTCTGTLESPLLCAEARKLLADSQNFQSRPNYTARSRRAGREYDLEPHIIQYLDEKGITLEHREFFIVEKEVAAKLDSPSSSKYQRAIRVAIDEVVKCLLKARSDG